MQRALLPYHAGAADDVFVHRRDRGVAVHDAVGRRKDQATGTGHGELELLLFI